MICKISNEDLLENLKDCKCKTWTCDFVITKLDGSEIWLEIDGMFNSRKDPYASGNNEKIEYYKANNVNYFIVTYRLPDIKKEICRLVS